MISEKQRIIQRIEEIKKMDIYEELERLYDRLEELDDDRICLNDREVNQFINWRM